MIDSDRRIERMEYEIAQLEARAEILREHIRHATRAFLADAQDHRNALVAAIEQHDAEVAVFLELIATEVARLDAERADLRRTIAQLRGLSPEPESLH